MVARLEEVFVLWSAARAEANLAYDAGCESPGTDAYLVYRAAEVERTSPRPSSRPSRLATLIFS